MDGPAGSGLDFVHDVDEIVMLHQGEIEVFLRGEDAPSRAGRGERDPGGREPHLQKHRKDYEPLVLRLPPGITDGVTTVRGTGGVTFGNNAR